MLKWEPIVAVNPASIIPLQAVKAHLRISDDVSQDALVGGLVAAAYQMIVSYVGTPFVDTEIRLFSPITSVVTLPHRYVDFILNIQVNHHSPDINPTDHLDYIFDNTQIDPVVRFTVLPVTSSLLSAPVAIEYSAGYTSEFIGDNSAYRQAMLILIADMYYNNTAVSPQTLRAMEALLEPFRRAM